MVPSCATSSQGLADCTDCNAADTMLVLRALKANGVLKEPWNFQRRLFHGSICPFSAARGGVESEVFSSQKKAGSPPAQDIKHISQTLKLVALIRAFRSRGHFAATLGEGKYLCST
jgi:2-oxoglutarate dehydrogenase complex dehydrogenase (E1) component-like enzyme